MSEIKTPITFTQSASARIVELLQKPKNQGKFFRVGVSSGGCSGFQYLFNLDDKHGEDDLEVLASDGAVIGFTDETSLDFLKDCTVDFVNELGASYFKVINPQAKASCGCGSSFAV